MSRGQFNFQLSHRWKALVRQHPSKSGACKPSVLRLHAWDRLPWTAESLHRLPDFFSYTWHGDYSGQPPPFLERSASTF
jgi:hypothetical protein